jgi:hypothetical protein
VASISKVKIGNMALSHVGDDSAMETFEDGTTSANTVIDVISDDSTDLAYLDWKYRYQYPSDCVAARHIVNPNGKNDDAVPFEIETGVNGDVKTILTDMEDAILVYTFDVEQTSLFTSHFVDTLAVLLAHRIAFSLTGQRSTASDMLNLYTGMIRVAPAHNANERVSAPPRDAPWIRGR